MKLVFYKLYDKKKYKKIKIEKAEENDLKNLINNNKKIGKHSKIYPQYQISNCEIGDYTYIA